MARLTSVTIRRFKRIEDLTLQLDDVTLLIGANNSGKSSILQAIHFAVSIAQTARFVGEGVSWGKDKFELSYNPSPALFSSLRRALIGDRRHAQEPRQSQIEIEFRDETGATCIDGLRRRRNRNIAVSLVGPHLGEQLMAVDKPFTVYAPGLAGVPKEERYMSPGVVRRIVARGDANLTLRKVLRMLKSNEPAWKDFIDDMQSIFAGIEIAMEFDEDTDENINVYFQFPGGTRLPVDAAGTSVLQASQILAYISLFAPQVLILDEPDSHLHPDNQRILCDLIFKLAAKRRFQALISTHSPDYSDDPATHRRGKIVLGRLIALLQQELRAKPRVYFPSAYLKHDGISSVAASIWSPPGAVQRPSQIRRAMTDLSHETTYNPLRANNFYKVEKWSNDEQRVWRG